MKVYRIVVGLNLDRTQWAANCIDAMGCISDGDTKEEAIENCRAAIMASIQGPVGPYKIEVLDDEKKLATN